MPVPAATWQATEHPVDEGWHNWSGSLRFRPSKVFAPSDSDELADILRTAGDSGRTVRPIGAAHSSTPIIGTDDILVSLERLSGVRSVDPSLKEAVVGAGTRLDELGKDLFRHGLAFPTYGDVATQTIAGVISTGTHGSGLTLHNLSMMLCGGALITGRGEVLPFSADNDGAPIRALRVSLGTLGIFTEMRLRLLPAYELRRIEWCTTTSALLPELDRLIAENRNFDFYWYPRSDEIKLRCLNAPDQVTDYSAIARRGEDRTGPPHEVIPKHSGLAYRFEEMEYALPFEAGKACFMEVRKRMLAKWRRTVAWRVLYRVVKGDDSWLSEAEGRDRVTISLHQNATLPYASFFADIEPIFRDHGGRPHWAKQHSLSAAELRPLYPHWAAFLDLRRRLDPGGVLLTPYLRRLLGVAS